MPYTLRSNLAVSLLLVSALVGLGWQGLPPETMAQSPSPVQVTRFTDAIESASQHCEYGHAVNWETRTPLSVDKFNFKQAWNIEVGLGRGQVVGDRQAIYIASGSSKKTPKTKQVEVMTSITARHPDTGKELWTYNFETATKFPKQETFGGAQVSPNATPIVIQDHLIALSFTGQLVCLNRADGQLIWKKDLVADLEANPVQFGFSASLVAGGNERDEVVVLAGGEQATAGLLNLDVASGKINWRCKLQSSSYATPVRAKLGGINQWVVMTQDEIAGISQADGKMLWSYSLPLLGMTNVPCPVVLSDKEIFISGQGIGGNRVYSVSRVKKRNREEWLVDEVWYQPRAKFFYSNYTRTTGDQLMGCVGNFLTRVDLGTGDITGKWRGFKDGNVVALKHGWLVISGKGKCSLIRKPQSADQASATQQASSNDLEVINQFSLVKGRCWTPPTILGNRLFLRFDDRLACFQISSELMAGGIESSLTSIRKLQSKPRQQGPSIDPVTAIFEAFENGGQAAALKQYQGYRSRKQLTDQHRVALAEAAWEQGFRDLAKMVICQHRQEFAIPVLQIILHPKTAQTDNPQKFIAYFEGCP